jgi:hypothetical protein
VPLLPPYAGGLGVALVVVGVLALVLRWAYGRDDPRPGPDADFGMLTEVATESSPAAGRRVVAALRAAGIRSTMTTDRAGRVHVMVFATDADRARDVVEQV